MASWIWAKKTAGNSHSSGERKTFRNHLLEAPADLAANKPSNAAAIFAREVLQNSRDAAVDRREQLGKKKNGGPTDDFEMRFEFKDLTGDAKKQLVEALDLVEYVKRAETRNATGVTLGLPESLSRERLTDESSPLRVLYVQEQGTSGLYGVYETSDSKFDLALCSEGDTDKEAGKGGAYGFGKAGLVMGTQSSLVVAYSCFDAQNPDQESTTRRALGVAYWPTHQREGVKYTGWGRLGALQSGDDLERVFPFEDEEADQFAAALKISPRNPFKDGYEGTGTVFVLIEPRLNADDLVKSVSRYWWPAITDGAMRVVVDDNDGERVIRPVEEEEFLTDFRAAYVMAKEAETFTAPDVDPSDESPAWERLLKGKREATGQEPPLLGRMALCAETDKQSWSWEPTIPGMAVDDVRRMSLVALIRETGMVVAYRPSGGPQVSLKRPFLRGVFLADSESEVDRGKTVNQFLSLTEPPAHDHWEDVVDASNNEPDRILGWKLARQVHERLDQNVREFRAKLQPSGAEREETVSFPLLAKHLAGPTKGRVPPKPPERRTGKYTTISSELLMVDGQDELRRRKWVVDLTLQSRAAFDEGIATVKFSYRLSEDDSDGDVLPLFVEAPDEFELLEEDNELVTAYLVDEDGFSRTHEKTVPRCHVYRGPVTKVESVRFTVVTAPFMRDWTVKRVFEYDVTEKGGADG